MVGYGREMGLRGLVLVMGCGLGCGMGQAVLQSKGGVEAREAVKGAAVPALREAMAKASVRLVRAGAGRGEVWLEVSARAEGQTLTLRVPLSSTEDAYGESRACVVKADGRREFVFSAGLDERNYAEFKVAEKDKAVELLGNKYLCRAMAAPFDCAGKAVQLTGDWSKWTLGEASAVTLGERDAGDAGPGDAGAGAGEGV